MTREQLKAIYTEAAKMVDNVSATSLPTIQKKLIARAWMELAAASYNLESILARGTAQVSGAPRPVAPANLPINQPIADLAALGIELEEGDDDGEVPNY